MATTNLNISVIEKRMFKETEAASYAGLPVKHFKIAWLTASIHTSCLPRPPAAYRCHKRRCFGR